MELYLLLESISEIFVAIICIITILIIEVTSINEKRNITLFYIDLGLICFAIFNIANALSIVLINADFSRIAGIVIFPTVLFIIIGINYTKKESYFSKVLILIITLGGILVYLGLQPEAIQMDKDIQIYGWYGSFRILVNLFYFIIPLYLLYWGYRTWRNSPFTLKKDTLIFFIGLIILSMGVILFMFLVLINPLLIIAVNISILIGFSIISFIIAREPKILHILPFQIFRIIVKNRDGQPIYDYNWSDYDISEIIFTEFLNAIQMISEEIMNIGGVLDIKLEEGILHLNDSKYITVGIVTSRSSKSLRESLIDFTDEFENKYERLLKKTCIDMNEYKSAYVLIKKHFPNSSSRFIKSKKSPIYLPNKLRKPLNIIDNKIKNIIQDTEEYEIVLEDLVKSPMNTNSDFLELYEELKDEPDKEFSFKIPKNSNIGFLDFKEE